MKKKCKYFNVFYFPENILDSKMDATFTVKILNERNQNDVDQSKGNDTNDTGSNLIKELKINLTSLKSNFMDEETGKVNYVKMLDSEDFTAYRR